MSRLDGMARGLRAAAADNVAEDEDEEFDPATDDEMFDLVDKELRTSDLD
jgi:hypothetical protein